MFVIGAEDGNLESILPFAGMRALSLQTNPSIASRPFDVARDGFVGTGGSTVLVLESEEEVERRHAKVYCEVAGWGQASDGHNVAISHPDGVGLRMAIGAAQSDVLKMVLRQGMVLSLAGILVGGVASVAVARLLAAGMAGLGASNLATYVAVPLLLICLTLAASYFPARRASKVDPVRALRYE